MPQKPENLLSEYSKILSGQVSLFIYQMSNFCVKADPVALLSIEVPSQDGKVGLEQVCSPTQIDDYTYAFLPFSESELPNIVRGVAHDHPEFKIEYVMLRDDGVYPVEKKYEEDSSYFKVVSARVPEVNGDRRNTILDGIKALYERCKFQYDKYRVDYSKRLTELSAGYSPENVKALNDKMDEVTDEYVDIREKAYAEKQKEVEDAYQKYLSDRNITEEQEREASMAKGDDVVQGFNMFDNLNE